MRRLAGLPRQRRYKASYAGAVTAAALTSPAAAARTVTTVRSDDAGAAARPAAGRGRPVLGAPRRGAGRLGRGRAAGGHRARTRWPRRPPGGPTTPPACDVDDDARRPRLRAGRCSPASPSTRRPGRRSSSSRRSPSAGGTASAGSPPSATSTRATVPAAAPPDDDAAAAAPLRRRRPGPGHAGAPPSRPPSSGSAPASWRRSCWPATCWSPPTRPLDPRRLLRRLAARFPDCWTFAVDGLLGATPELLLRRTGRQLSARVLAGTAPRGAGADDERLADGADRLGQGPRRARARGRLAGRARSSPTARRWTRPAEPELLTLANVRHLATDVTGTQRRRGPRGAAGLLELIGAVHPTAAVCGTPDAGRRRA